MRRKLKWLVQRQQQQQSLRTIMQNHFAIVKSKRTKHIKAWVGAQDPLQRYLDLHQRLYISDPRN